MMRRVSKKSASNTRQYRGKFYRFGVEKFYGITFLFAKMRKKNEKILTFEKTAFAFESVVQISC